MIELRHLNKTYENAEPLRDVSATVNDGDVIAIIGPSGTGKSTLLRCINLLEKPTGGQIFLNGEEITARGYDARRARRKMGMVFQSFNLFGHLTVIENLMTPPMDLLGKSKQEAYDTAVELLDENSVLVVVDTNNPVIVESPKLLESAKTIVVLDHHRQSERSIRNASLSYVETYASSASEMVAEIVQYISDDVKIRVAEADAMYAGIVIDTHDFKNQTGVRTFEAAAFLRRNGVDVTRVRKMFREKIEDYRAKAEAVHNAEIYREHFAMSICPSEGLETPTIIGAQASNDLLDIVGVKASVVMTEYGEKIFISARSIDEVNVQVMMEKLGGGGHRTMAGAQLTGVTLEEAAERVKEVIDDMIEKGEIA